MEMIKVTSSNVSAIGFDGSDLYVDYYTKSGIVSYIYKKVEQSLFEALKAAQSKGSFISSNIKGKYDCYKHAN